MPCMFRSGGFYFKGDGFDTDKVYPANVGWN
jgi:hypothetical protein